MVVPCATLPGGKKITRAAAVPTIDLSVERSVIRKRIFMASEDYGIFNVVNHGVSIDVVRRLERQGLEFFAELPWENMAARILGSMSASSFYLESVLKETDKLCDRFLQTGSAFIFLEVPSLGISVECYC
ncbi:hypothetical protein Nepgr_012620 [Nepenthes gracilis]|uniref:Non-haem dioxygenase N-terminal domain-containing protein n=1 Tax=Nepenthes gracilis TaxID=150966 RepID=A0AAD3SHJ3_NEPGR|nr:hypothetical protein Nepgr_012620 [Nepenthes gracilis]